MARADARHSEATELLHRYGNERLITSTHVRGETWMFLRRRSGHEAVVAFLDARDGTSRPEVVFVGEDVEADALRRRGIRSAADLTAGAGRRIRSRAPHPKPGAAAGRRSRPPYPAVSARMRRVNSAACSYRPKLGMM